MNLKEMEAQEIWAVLIQEIKKVKYKSTKTLRISKFIE